MDENTFKQLEDDDIPVVENTETIRELKEKYGRGFWGNNTTGYLDEDDE